ncbi:nuclease EXOG, mitochondrial [Anolis carolinensis]|uniref:Nuclease EXOG, mitochondrial n=1 Tax=Anolis carolinensis TaxID=28377 RepID=H9GEU7_ANOCA|nr:PREDICTED: nuclease EXOG, mitochondrial [Anolis carolinensis]|eukprot:XP_003227857.1 PREDICTED: nuclease EXOG, mitochondrial [Anolis carolinensis]
MAGVWGSRLARSHFLGGFLCGATASGLAAIHLLRKRPKQAPSDSLTEKPPKPPPLLQDEPLIEPVLEKYGFPNAGTQVRYYTNHALSYDQAKRVPRWVIEHISKQKTLGSADRKHCKFRPDPSISPMFSAMNEDYLGSGWSRGHMAPAGDNKYSPKAMAETFYLSNIVPQNYENNAGFWNRIEMYCRELTERFEDIWIVSGPLTLPQMEGDGKKRVTYQVIGKDDVAVPSHLYKVILARRSKTSADPLVLGAFVVPNVPIGFDHQLLEFQVSIEELEKMSGLVFFPRVNKIEDVRDLCEIDTCKLMSLEEFTLYIATRKLRSARTLERLEKIMSELQEKEIKPDEYLLKVYEKKKGELATQKPTEAREARAG